MINYEPLTKVASDNSNVVECRLHGTEECHIHMSNGCYNCPVFKAILLQLNTFENIYMEEENEGEPKVE